MIIYHDENYQVTHVITYHDPTYKPEWNGNRFVHHDAIIPHERIHLDVSCDARGKTIVTPRKKHDFAFDELPASIRLGESVSISPIPRGTRIVVNGAPEATMDGSASLDFTPESTGLFALRFSLVGYMDKEVTLEVIRAR